MLGASFPRIFLIGGHSSLQIERLTGAARCENPAIIVSVVGCRDRAPLARGVRRLVEPANRGTLVSSVFALTMLAEEAPQAPVMLVFRGGRGLAGEASELLSELGQRVPRLARMFAFYVALPENERPRFLDQAYEHLPSVDIGDVEPRVPTVQLREDPPDEVPMHPLRRRRRLPGKSVDNTPAPGKIAQQRSS